VGTVLQCDGGSSGYPTMPKWEYRDVDLNDLSRNANAVDLLNNAGDDGWELIVITNMGIAYLKRPVPVTPAAAPGRRRKATSAGIE
jgi:hypothetical protein